jgi:flagellar biosynthesis protein FlhF
MRELYGEKAVIVKCDIIKTGGFFGFGVKEQVEATVQVPPKAPDLSKYASSIFKHPEAAPPATDVQQTKQKILEKAAEASGIDPKMQEVLIQLKNLTEKIDQKNEGAVEHQSIVKIRDLLDQNNFSLGFRKSIVERMKKELSFEELNDFDELQQKILEWIGGSVGIYRDEGPYRHPRIIVLVGPTGVGKTTTISKLAAGFKFGFEGEQPQKGQSVSFITIDLYRIGAEHQLRQIAQILKIPFATAGDGDELKKELALQSDGSDVILVDTIGRSPRDAMELAKMKKMLEACGRNAEVYLTVMAGTTASELGETMRQFEPFGYRGVIVTKLDETRQAGNVFSALSEMGKPLAWTTDGQNSVPQYIKKASVMRLLMNLDGFMLDRDRLEAHFLYQ